MIYYCIFFQTTTGSIGHDKKYSENYPPTYEDIERWQDEISNEFEVQAIIANIVKLKGIE